MYLYRQYSRCVVSVYIHELMCICTVQYSRYAVSVYIHELMCICTVQCNRCVVSVYIHEVMCVAYVSLLVRNVVGCSYWSGSSFTQDLRSTIKLGQASLTTR